MPQPQFRASLGTYGTDDRSVPSANIPGNNGDLLVSFFVDDGATASLVAPAGWTSGHASVQSQGHTSAWWWRVKDGTEADPSVWTTDTAAQAAILHIIAVDPNSGSSWIIADEDVTTGAAPSQVAVGPTITCPADAFYLALFTNDSGVSVSASPSMTTIVATEKNTGLALAGMSYYELRSAGDISSTLTYDLADEWHAYGIAIAIGSTGGGTDTYSVPRLIGPGGLIGYGGLIGRSSNLAG